MDLVVPNRSKSIREGAIQPWSTPKFKEHLRALLRVAPKAGIRVDIPYSALSEDEVRMVREGTEGCDGIDTFFRMVEKKAYKIFYRVLLSRYRAYTICPACDGARLRKEALNVRICGKRLPDIVRMTVADARAFIATLDLTAYETSVARRILEELNKRLAYLDDVGIGYLTLDRLSNTLSGANPSASILPRRSDPLWSGPSMYWMSRASDCIRGTMTS
jgi:excinuclease ABC subunit A